MSKQEEIKQALAAATPGPWNKEGDEIWRRGSGYGGDDPHVYICDATSENANLIAKAPEYIAYLLAENERLGKRHGDTDSWIVWDQQEKGLVCIEERDKAFQEYEKRLEVLKDEVSSCGSIGEEHVILARIEKQAQVVLEQDPEHSDDVAVWHEFERKTNDELDRLRKELEEAQQALDEPRKNLWFKYTNERNRAEEARRGAERALSSHRYMEEELIKAQKELEKEQRSKDVMSNYLNELMNNTANTVIASQIYNVLREAIGREEFDPVGQEGEGNQDEQA